MNKLVIDFETSGVNFRRDEPLQIAAVLLDENLVELDSYMSYIKPDSIDDVYKKKVAASIHKIARQTLEEAPSLRTVMTEFRSKFVPHTDFMLMGHNIDFDINFLRRSHERLTLDYDYQYRTIDTMSCAAMLADMGLLQLKKFNLGDLCRHFKIDTEGAHDALKDVRMTAELYREFINLLKKKKG